VYLYLSVFSLTALFVWFFAIDVGTQEQLSEFPDNWHIIDLITNGFAILMFGGATRASYRVIMEIWCAEEGSITLPPDVPMD